MKENQLSEEFFSIARNLSGGGISLVTPQKIENKTILQLMIELPDFRDPIQCLSRVVRVSQSLEDGHYETGVCFLDVTGKDRQRLEAFVT